MDVFVAGGYTTKFGELWNIDFRQLGVEAAIGAVKDASLELEDIDAIYVGNMGASRFAGQDHIGALFASELGLDCPAFHIEGACASGGLAFRSALLDLLSGSSKNVLVLGVEKMTDVGISTATTALAGASDEEWEAFYGVTFPSLYAMIAREHMRLYGTTREQLASVAVKNHSNGSKNPNAQYRNKLTIEQVLHSSMVSDPLTLMDCSPISDGASAVVISSSTKSNVKVIGSGHAQDSLALHDRDDITTIKATRKASEIAFKQSGINHKDIDLIEVHDCFTIAEICAIEDLGFVEKGMGGSYSENGNTQLDGELPVNSSGGLKAAGHPVGATGIKQIVEIYHQMKGNAGERQVKNVRYGLTHNVGGSGATSVVHIFENIRR
jgi:acetyl-CoA C-acetyltransferase